MTKKEIQHLVHCFELRLKSITPPRNSAEKYECMMLRDDIKKLRNLETEK